MKEQSFYWKKNILLENISYQSVINWVSGEFDLFQQDIKKGLKIYCPNSEIYIKKTKNTNLMIAVIKSKSNYSGAKYRDKLNFVLGLLINYNQYQTYNE